MIKTVVDKFLVEIQVQLDEKNVQLDVSEEAREWLAANGYDEKMGARPMQRLIKDRIKKELAEDILFGKLSQWWPRSRRRRGRRFSPGSRGARDGLTTHGR